jgi:hypothetical protein
MAGVYPAAAGIRNIGDSTMKYIPTIYSGKMLVKFYTATVMGAVANTDYEGEIKAQGESVEIRGLPDITISDHKKGQALKYEQPEAAPVTLNIDQGKSWSFATNIVDDKQTDIKNYAEKWSEVAMRQMKIAVDSDLLSTVYADASAYNKGATAGYRSGNVNLGVDGGASVALDKTNVIEKIIECGQVLDEIDVPEDDRWIIIPAWMASIIKMSDIKDASLAGDGTSIMRNGRLGIIGNFTLYQSNQLPTTADGSANTCHHIMFGTKHAITFAAQITENENLPNPNAFGTLFRGLMVYGMKVVKPEALGVLYARKSA